MMELAEEGQHKLLVGQLASLIAGATKHLFAPDIRFTRLEHARQVRPSSRTFPLEGHP